MRRDTTEALVGINRRFYSGQSARQFNDTRAHPWPGFRGILPWLADATRHQVLDVGCGNGRLLPFLAANLDVPVDYHGVDFSEALLGHARDAMGTRYPSARFDACDLTSPAPPLPPGPFTCIALVAVLHHLPGAALRADLVRALVQRLAPDGILVLTAWRFDRIEGMGRRRLAWEELSPTLHAHVALSDLDPGDELIAWGPGTGALRYCHLLDDARLDALIASSGGKCVARYAADGAARNHNEYVILRRDLVSTD